MNTATLNSEQLRIEKSPRPKERPPLVQRFQQTKERLRDSVNRIKTAFGQLINKTNGSVDLTEEQHTLGTLGNQFNEVTSGTEKAIRTDSLMPDRTSVKTEADDKNSPGMTTHPEITFSASTKFERISLPEGQLLLVKPLPKDFPQDFQKKLITAEPWYGKGERLRNFRRRIERFTINGVAVVLKQIRLTGEDVRRTKSRSEALTNTISAQVGILEHAKVAYRKAYGEELPVEEVIAAYIDRASTQKYLMYRYYDVLDLSDYWRDAEKASILGEVNRQIEEIDEKLYAIGVHRGEGGNYIVARDPKSEKGWRVILIDTEFWRIKGRYDLNTQF